ncbi:MAG: FAD-binding protein, partial [Gammaproteobacteria bacterium]
MDKLLEQLYTILPAAAVITGTESLRVYECDALSAYRTIPRCVVLPDNISQVHAVLRLCHEMNVPVVARGAGTGLSGGALPVAGGLVLSLAKFNRILAIDPLQRIARVQPGVRNLSVSEAADVHGLFYAPDPSSQIACTIGGNVAENSGGVHCLKYGLTVHNVMALKLVTMEGELLEVGSEALDTAGYDLLALLTGSEGMLGVVVEATLKLLPKPVARQVLLAAFNSVDDAGHAVAAIIAAGIIPAGLEMMDNAGIRAVEAYVQAGYPVDAEAILLCEIDGVPEEVLAEGVQVDRILREGGAAEVRMARDQAEGDRFWAGRKAAFPAVGRISPD